MAAVDNLQIFVFFSYEMNASIGMLRLEWSNNFLFALVRHVRHRSHVLNLLQNLEVSAIGTLTLILLFGDLKLASSKMSSSDSSGCQLTCSANSESGTASGEMMRPSRNKLTLVTICRLIFSGRLEMHVTSRLYHHYRVTYEKAVSMLSRHTLSIIWPHTGKIKLANFIWITVSFGYRSDSTTFAETVNSLRKLEKPNFVHTSHNVEEGQQPMHFLPLSRRQQTHEEL